MRSPVFFWGLGVLLLVVFVNGTIQEQNGNRIDTDTDNVKDSDLIDQVLSSDYFEDDKEDKSSIPDPDGSLPVQPSVSNDEDEESFSVTSKPPFCLGCPVEVDVDNDKIKEIAIFAFESHLKSFDALEKAQRMVRVVNAMTQVVAGQKYILDLEVLEMITLNK
jgi:hypothetical protein